MPRKIEVIGRKFNMLTVIKLVDRVGPKKRERYLCRCDCGNDHYVVRDNLIWGGVKSCGCLLHKPPPNKTHGKKNHPLYGNWQNMKNRCYNKNVPAYEYYGQRGIDVCKEWLHDFQNYYDWAMANGWRHGLEIDRKDNDKGYSPDNCRVVTQAVNLSNKGKYRNNKTGFTGVLARGKRFIAQVSIGGGNRHYIGTFGDPVEAARAREKYIASRTQGAV